MKEWITVSEASLRANIPEKRIQNWIKEQYITAKIENGGYLIDSDSLKKFEEQNKASRPVGQASLLVMSGKDAQPTKKCNFLDNKKMTAIEVGDTISQDEKLIKKFEFEMNNNMTGNVYALCLTDKRMIIEFVKGLLESLGCAFYMFCLIVGVGLGSLIFVLLSAIANYAGIRGAEANLLIGGSCIAVGIGTIAICKSIKDILVARSSGKRDIVINYNDILRVILKRKSIPIGYSMFKMESIERKLVLKFKRENFDDFSQLLVNLLPNKVELK